mgnify:CR=1 FL=1
MRKPSIPKAVQYKDWELPPNMSKDVINRIIGNGTYNSFMIAPERLALWPIHTNKCTDHFLHNTSGWIANHPDASYTSRNMPLVVTTYNVGKLCQHWLQHSTLHAVKPHMLRLNEKMDVSDFVLGPSNAKSKCIIYAIYSEILKISQ